MYFAELADADQLPQLVAGDRPLDAARHRRWEPVDAQRGEVGAEPAADELVDVHAGVETDHVESSERFGRPPGLGPGGERVMSGRRQQDLSGIGDGDEPRRARERRAYRLVLAHLEIPDVDRDPDALAHDEARGADAWPVDTARFPRVAGLAAAPAPAFPPCPPQLGLYPVVPDAEWVERVLDCGARTVQLRVKDANPDALRREIARAVAAGRHYPDARVFINDHWQIAVEEGAYGVHLGQEDLETADLAAIARAGLRLGLSSHGYYEMLRALHERPSYLALGPVYATATKAVAAPPQGLARIARYARFAGARAPLVAIGGVGLDALPDVLATGVGSVAVVSAVTGAIDYRAAIVALQQCFARQFDNH